jgi:hypothetical protein
MSDALKNKLIEEKLVFVRFCWDQYMKFYTVFLTTNIIAVGLVVEHVHSRWDRFPIAIVFIVQNILAAITPLKLKALSQSAKEELARALETTKEAEPLQTFMAALDVVPAHFAVWVGVANSIAQFGLAVLWILLVLFASA